MIEGSTFDKNVSTGHSRKISGNAGTTRTERRIPVARGDRFKPDSPR
jgi:hypothetical protein